MARTVTFVWDRHSVPGADDGDFLLPVNLHRELEDFDTDAQVTLSKIQLRAVSFDVDPTLRCTRHYTETDILPGEASTDTRWHGRSQRYRVEMQEKRENGVGQLMVWGRFMSTQIGGRQTRGSIENPKATVMALDATTGEYLTPGNREIGTPFRIGITGSGNHTGEQQYFPRRPVGTDFSTVVIETPDEATEDLRQMPITMMQDATDPCKWTPMFPGQLQETWFQRGTPAQQGSRDILTDEELKGDLWDWRELYQCGAVRVEGGRLVRKDPLYPDVSQRNRPLSWYTVTCDQGGRYLVVDDALVEKRTTSGMSDESSGGGFIIVSTEIEPRNNDTPGRRKSFNLVPRLLRRQTARNISDPVLSASPPMPKSLQFNSAGGVSLQLMFGAGVARDSLKPITRADLGPDRVFYPQMQAYETRNSDKAKLPWAPLPDAPTQQLRDVMSAVWKADMQRGGDYSETESEGGAARQGVSFDRMKVPFICLPAGPDSLASGAAGFIHVRPNAEAQRYTGVPSVDTDSYVRSAVTGDAKVVLESVNVGSVSPYEADAVFPGPWTPIDQSVVTKYAGDRDAVDVHQSSVTWQRGVRKTKTGTAGDDQATRQDMLTRAGLSNPLPRHDADSTPMRARPGHGHIASYVPVELGMQRFWALGSVHNVGVGSTFTGSRNGTVWKVFRRDPANKVFSSLSEEAGRAFQPLIMPVHRDEETAAVMGTVSKVVLQIPPAGPRRSLRRRLDYDARSSGPSDVLYDSRSRDDPSCISTVGLVRELHPRHRLYPRGHMQIFTMYHLCQNRDDGYAPTYSQGDLLFRTITFAADPPAYKPNAVLADRQNGLCQLQEFWEVIGVCVNNDLVASQSHDEWDWRAQNTVSYRQTADPDGVETMVTGMDVVFSFMCRKKDSRLVTVKGGLAQNIAHYADVAHALGNTASLIPQTRSMRCDIMGSLDDDATELGVNSDELSMIGKDADTMDGTGITPSTIDTLNFRIYKPSENEGMFDEPFNGHLPQFYAPAATNYTGIWYQTVGGTFNEDGTVDVPLTTAATWANPPLDDKHESTWTPPFSASGPFVPPPWDALLPEGPTLMRSWAWSQSVNGDGTRPNFEKIEAQTSGTSAVPATGLTTTKHLMSWTGYPVYGAMMPPDLVVNRVYRTSDEPVTSAFDVFGVGSGGVFPQFSEIGDSRKNDGTQTPAAAPPDPADSSGTHPRQMTNSPTFQNPQDINQIGSLSVFREPANFKNIPFKVTSTVKAAPRVELLVASMDTAPIRAGDTLQFSSADLTSSMGTGTEGAAQVQSWATWEVRNDFDQQVGGQTPDWDEHFEIPGAWNGVEFSQKRWLDSLASTLDAQEDTDYGGTWRASSSKAPDWHGFGRLRSESAPAGWRGPVPVGHAEHAVRAFDSSSSAWLGAQPKSPLDRTQFMMPWLQWANVHMREDAVTPGVMMAEFDMQMLARGAASGGQSMDQAQYRIV